MVLRPVPPIPVASFRNQDFFEGELPLGLAGSGGRLRVEVSRMVKIVPGAVVFRGANPDVEIGMDPRPWDQRLERGKMLLPLNGLGHRRCLHSSLALQRIVEAA